ncbi:hypothetical protein [Bartonella sp. LJL80]
MIWPFRKQAEKTFKATAFGHYATGVSCREVYINLFEHEDGSRSYTEHFGKECDGIPDDAAFSVKAEAEAWQYKGSLPRCLFNALDRFPLEVGE